MTCKFPSMNLKLPDLDRGEAPCPRCGGNASWMFTSPERSWVEVACADCGKFELPAHEFNRAETELSAPEERE